MILPSKKQVVRYALFPEVKPRIQNLISEGFANLAVFMALIFQTAQLLPKHHPYLQPGTTGTFGIRNVLSEASSNLVYDYKHLDQIIVFFALLAGIAILAIQFCLLIFSFIAGNAWAQTPPAQNTNFFITPNPSEDLAFRLLDSVFGVPGIFGSIEKTQTPFHEALHQLFIFYSTGLLVIAAILIIYFIFAILAETAQTGTPFGKRYKHVWVPLRLVVAIGLLIPIGTGLNSGQWIALYAAKFGSGFATNGWIKLNDTIRSNPISDDELVAKVNIADLEDLAAFMMIVHGCEQAYKETYNADIGQHIDAHIMSERTAYDAVPLREREQPWTDANLVESGIIRIRFGHKNERYKDSEDKIFPYCGELLITNVGVDKSDPSSPDKVTGAQKIAWAYYTLIFNMWTNEGGKYTNLINIGKNIVHKHFNNNPDDGVPFTKEFKSKTHALMQAEVQEGVEEAVAIFKEELAKNLDYKKFGWAGAGIFYNDIADTNGKLTNAILNKPLIRAFPSTMEKVCEENKQQNNKTTPKACFNTELATGKPIQFISQKDKEIEIALNSIFRKWAADSAGNIFIAVINATLGTQGIFDMCKNKGVHPLAQLSATGKGLVESAIRNLGFGIGGGAAGMLAPYFGPALESASGFFVTAASVAILMGFILYYIVPFLPFVYFLFGVGGWVKGLFEAMVGIPLWALAHIRIDGEGLPGDGALNGYFLIFEIFVRPILIIFGLLASILIFGAMVKILNDIFSLAVSNLSGFESGKFDECLTKEKGGIAPTGSAEYFRGPVDVFFFTIMLTIMVYMIGMSCFKLIDSIPNKILRWMGTGVHSFNDQSGDPADGLVSKLAIGGSILGQTLSGVGGNFAKALKGER